MPHHEDDKKMSWRDWIREQDDPVQAASKPEALDHLTVLDCSYGSIAGCFASSILGELGAEVIRIEAPEGDPERTFSPWGIMHKDTGLGYLNEGRNKFHVTLNLQSRKDRKSSASWPSGPTCSSKPSCPGSWIDGASAIGN